MSDIVNEPRKNNQLPVDFKEKFAGTPLENNLLPRGHLSARKKG